jgi:hypothetical protein
MNPPSAVILVGLAVDGWLLALIAVRGRRPWLQATYAACALSFLVVGASAVGETEGLFPVRDDVVLGLLLLTHALTAILVLSLIHGEVLPRERAATFLLLAPVPLLAYFAPGQRWTVATAYDGNVLGGFLVLCLGIALAETIYARRASPMFAAQAFWMTVGVVALIVGGPIYTYELPLLQQASLGGANAAAPLALACFARVALVTDPYPISPRPSKGRSASGQIGTADAIVFDERRPKYALRTVDEEASSGRATLLLGRTAPRVGTSGSLFASLDADRHVALRAMTTASEFLTASPGGLLVVEGLADLSALTGWASVREVVVRLRHLARETHSTVILCPSRLTESERKALSDLNLLLWPMADPATELVAILAQSFGSGAGRLFDSFCRAHGLRREDVTTDHVQALQEFLSRALSELTSVVGGPAAHGLRTQYEAASSVLRSYAMQGATEIARGKWPSRNDSQTEVEFVVTAADYWKGKEMEELFAAADAMSESEPLFEKARLVFVEQLGDAGEGVLRTQLARLGKKPEELDKADLVRIADRATVDLGSLAEVVDLPGERDRIQKQIESIRQKLELIAEGHE